MADATANAGRTPIFLYGAGGHARAVAEVVHRHGVYEIAVVLADDAETAKPIAGIRVQPAATLQRLVEHGPRQGFIAIGDNANRKRVTSLALESGLVLVTLVDPAALVARGVPVGAGAVVMPGVIVNTGATIAEHVILNTACTVDHDTVVRSYAHLSPGVHVSGECDLGTGCLLGIAASVIQCIHIGDGARIGAGAAVIDDVAAGAVAVGVPARTREPNAAERAAE